MKPYPSYIFPCAEGCGQHVCEPKKKCAMCEASDIGPIESAFYRWGCIFMEGFDRLKWLPKTCAILLAAGLILLIVRMGFGAVVIHREVAEWRAMMGGLQ